jgi:outer membrane receptor protein involved in Fe transport
MRLPRPRRIWAAPCACTARARWLALALALLLAGTSAAEQERSMLLAQTDEEPASDAADAAPQEEPAPAGDDQPPNVEVLTVRGRSAAAIETDVPSSITQFDASMIQALGAQDVSDLARVTPNVNIVQPGATQATFFVRGIGLQSFDANSTGAVTIFQDSVSLDLAAIQTGQLFDIQEVAILRGPQGTGPYRNASAGAISVSSSLPSGNFGAQLRSSIGRYAAEGGKGALRARIQDYEGYLEAPLVEEWLSSRVAFRLRNSDPYQRNGCGNAIPFEARTPRPKSDGTFRQIADSIDVCGERGLAMFPPTQVSRIPVGLDDEVDFEDTWAARGFLRMKPPSGDLDIVLNLHGSRLDEDQTYGQAIGTRGSQERPGARFFGGGTGSEGFPSYQEPDQRQEVAEICSVANCGGFPNVNIQAFESTLAEERPLDRKPYRGDYNREGKTTRDTWGGYLSGEAQLGDVKLFAISSYDGYERFRSQDTDFTPEVLFEIVEDDEAWQTYQSLEATGELGLTLLEWNLGGYYAYSDLDDESTTFLASNNRIERNFSQQTDAFGVWGGFDWDFLDDVTLAGGVRWNWERKKFQLDRQTLSPLFNIPLSALSTDQDETWQTPTGNLILTYHFNDRASAFAKYSRGFKAGHFNAIASEDIDRPPADPEYNDAWEAGLAGSWFDRRLSGTVNYFYYRYEDYQVFLFRDVANAPPVLEIINAKSAENYGIEVEGNIEPLRGWAPRAIDGLLLTANFGWLHGEFLDFQIRNTLPLGSEAVPVTIDFSGDSLLNSPQYKFSFAANWTFDLDRFGSLIPRYDVSWTDDVFFGLNEGRGTSPLDLEGNPRLPEYAVGQKAYFIHNVRLAYRTPSGNVEVAVFCRNLEDEVYKTYAFDATNFSNVTLNFVGTPRTIGMDMIITF